MQSAPPDPLLIAADLFDPPVSEHETDRAECRASAAAFVERHCSIRDNDGSTMSFVPWECQRDVLAALQARDPAIILKARQIGMSWTVLAFALWLATFQQGVRILLLCKTETDATELLNRIRWMRDQIAADPQRAHILSGLDRPTKERDAVTTLDVGTSTIRALVGTPAAARSETAGLVIADEFAFQRRADEIWRALVPTFEAGGRVVVLSTGNGPEQDPIGGEFAKLWAGAVAGDNGLRAFFYSWRHRPDRDDSWRERTLRKLGDPDRFRVEYPEEPADAFLSPDATLVYDRTHLAAACKLGDVYAAMPEPPGGPVWLGIDWGVHTHVLFARRLAGGGLWVFAEVFDDGRDLDVVTDAVTRKLSALGVRAEMERFDAAEPVVHTAFRKGFKERAGYNPRWGAVPFSKYKRWAIKYTQLILRGSMEDRPLGHLAISGCPELVRQLSTLQRDPKDDEKVVKGDDHGADALLTLTAELGEQHFQTTDKQEG